MANEADKSENERIKDGYEKILSEYEVLKQRINEAKKPSDPNWYEKSIQRQEEADKKFRRTFWLIASPFIILGLVIWFIGRNTLPEPVKYEDLTMCEQMWIDADPLYERYCVIEDPR